MSNVLERFKNLASELEGKEPVSVCDSCEETYPESWILSDGSCPFCAKEHTTDKK